MLLTPNIWALSGERAAPVRLQRHVSQLLVDRSPDESLHEIARALRSLEGERFIERLRVLRYQHKSPDTRQIRVSRHCLQKPLAQSLATIRFENVDITQVCERRSIGHDSREANLRAAIEQGKAKRTGERLRHDVFRD